MTTTPHDGDETSRPGPAGPGFEASAFEPSAIEPTVIETAEVEAVYRQAKGSADQGPTLYADRKKVHPRRVKGTFRSIKWAVMAVCLAIYYLSPWLRWDRGPHAPDQAILIDFPARRFYFFFIEIWPQEIYYITGLLIVAGLALFLFTALLGRVWCGYACPQTVWTDLFVTVERWVEGDRNARIRLDKAPWTGAKIGKRVVKHAIWLLIALATGGAWVFYFADAPTLAGDLIRLEAPVVAYGFIALFSATTYLLGGIAREQVCIYMCPWPRIQSAMFDEQSLLVTYRDWRGEPRGKHKKGDSWEGRGHCVDCKQCVVVCPMGIDIRDGMQLECIHCALCVDACNGVMEKLDLPGGLIGYDSPQGLADQRTKPVFNPFRARPILYALLISAVGTVMLFGLLTRSDLDLSVLRDRNPLFVTLSDGSLRNGYTLKVINKLPVERHFTVTPGGLAGLTIAGVGQDHGGQSLEVVVPPDDLASVKVYLTAPAEAATSASQPVTFHLESLEGDGSETVESSFRGPLP